MGYFTDGEAVPRQLMSYIKHIKLDTRGILHA